MARDTSFYYAFLMLPPAKRNAIVAVWDFCRAVDDAVDEVVPLGEVALLERGARDRGTRAQLSGGRNSIAASAAIRRQRLKGARSSRWSPRSTFRANRSTTSSTV